MGMNLGTTSQNYFCYFGVVRKKEKYIHTYNQILTLTPTYPHLILHYMQFFSLPFSLLLFFTGLSGKGDFLQFALALLKWLDRRRKTKYKLYLFSGQKSLLETNFLTPHYLEQFISLNFLHLLGIGSSKHLKMRRKA